ncbi:MAG: NAD-dependent epimerase/dehydratase family protein, partial [Thermoanaerobaculia bacterium]
MRVLITGASGFLGSHLGRTLRARGDEVVEQGPIDVVHHLAYDTRAEDPRFNVELAVRLVTAALDAGARHVVFASSGFVYGDAEVLPIPETHPTRPRTPNGWAKLWSEEALAELCARRGAALTILRYANLYGGGERDRSVIARFITALRDGRPAQIAGDGSQTRDFIHVDDVAAANLAAMRLEGTYNVGTGVETSILEAWET